MLVDQYWTCAEGLVYAVLRRYHGVYRRGERSWEARLEEERQERAAAEAIARRQADEVERARAPAAAPDLMDLGTSALQAPITPTHAAAGAAESDAVKPVQTATATGSPAAAAAVPHEMALRANPLDVPMTCPPGLDAVLSRLPVIVAASQVPRPHSSSADSQPQAAAATLDVVASRTASLDTSVVCHPEAIVIAPDAINRMEAESVAATGPNITTPNTGLLTAPMVRHSEAESVASDVASADLPSPTFPEARADTSATAGSALPRPGLVPGTAGPGPHPKAAADEQMLVTAPVSDKPATEMQDVEACAATVSPQDARPGPAPAPASPAAQVHGS